ncbi:tetratricopeptide repeat protein [Plectonema radiosum NIES-515]|jgi:tetratricopeptide (TPR) repeat protein|uniref:Tetratricopeptide repeat protein n=1 Tax=Plectonema radiosum NIES-515 TaxID=2986073 RepID=A0ABT3AWJ4_9CYAN|nr:tetratricopeptide repeat protein [Plectonema radiosum]MCV3212979.1 tetratricopeptide repeat protein [Plectonema radiosum NIES-515]
MSEIPSSSIFAIAVVILAIAILIYFSAKTLITSNLFQEGVTLYQKEDYPGAEAIFRKVISINSTNDVVRLLLGDVLTQQGNLDSAAEIFGEVINRSPKYADAYLRLSNVLMQQEKREEAIKNLQLAKDLLQKQRQTEKVEKITQILDKMTARSKKLS